jgi:hypothetical protein
MQTIQNKCYIIKDKKLIVCKWHQIVLINNIKYGYCHYDDIGDWIYNKDLLNYNKICTNGESY